MDAKLTAKEPERQEIKRKTAIFIKNGGVIKAIPPGDVSVLYEYDFSDSRNHRSPL